VIVPLQDTEISEPMRIILSPDYSPVMPISHETPCNSVLDILLACFPAAGQLGATPPNRLALAVREKTSETNPGGWPAVDLPDKMHRNRHIVFRMLDGRQLGYPAHVMDPKCKPTLEQAVATGQCGSMPTSLYYPAEIPLARV
jgi:hypothetical protein